MSTPYDLADADPHRLVAQGGAAARMAALPQQASTKVAGPAEIPAAHSFVARLADAQNLMAKVPPDRDGAVKVLRALAAEMKSIDQYSGGRAGVLDSGDARTGSALAMGRARAEVEIQAARIAGGAPPQWNTVFPAVRAGTESFLLANEEMDPSGSQLGRADGTMQLARYGQLAALAIPLLPALAASAWGWAVTSPFAALAAGELGTDVGLGMADSGGAGNWMRGIAEEPLALIPYLLPFVPGWLSGRRGGSPGAHEPEGHAPNNRQMTREEWQAAQSARRRAARPTQRVGVEPKKPVDVTVGPEPRTPAPGTRSMTKEAHAESSSARRAEERARNYDQPDPSTQHGHGDHGAQVTESQHRTRLQTGQTPSDRRTGRGVPPRPPPSSTNFVDSAAQVEAVERARRQLSASNAPKFRTNPRTGRQEPNRQEVRVTERSGGRPYGAGLTRRGPGATPESPNPTGPLRGAIVVLEYNPATDGWDVITSYPNP